MRRTPPAPPTVRRNGKSKVGSTYLAIGRRAAVRDDISEMTGHPAMSLQEALAAADH